MMHEAASTKIIVLGAPAVGKTALVIRCLNGQFFQNYISHSDTAYHFKAHGTIMDIVDSSGKNEALISYADGFVLVYSIIDRESFLYLHELLEKIRRVNLRQINIVIVGTKSDKQIHRKVSREEGEKYAIDNNCVFFETSSYIPKQDVKEVFCSVSKKTHPYKQRSQSEIGTRGRKYSMVGTLRTLVTRKRRFSTGNPPTYR